MFLGLSQSASFLDSHVESGSNCVCMVPSCIQYYTRNCYLQHYAQFSSHIPYSVHTAISMHIVPETESLSWHSQTPFMDICLLSIAKVPYLTVEIWFKRAVKSSLNTVCSLSIQQFLNAKFDCIFKQLSYTHLYNSQSNSCKF